MRFLVLSFYFLLNRCSFLFSLCLNKSCKPEANFSLWYFEKKLWFFGISVRWPEKSKAAEPFIVLAFVSFPLISCCQTRSRIKKVDERRKQSPLSFLAHITCFCLGSWTFSSRCRKVLDGGKICRFWLRWWASDYFPIQTLLEDKKFYRKTPRASVQKISALLIQRNLNSKLQSENGI